MDNADKASELEEISRAAALAAAQQRGETATGSTYCIDCGDEIPAARRDPIEKTCAFFQWEPASSCQSLRATLH